MRCTVGAVPWCAQVVAAAAIRLQKEAAERTAQEAATLKLQACRLSVLNKQAQVQVQHKRAQKKQLAVSTAGCGLSPCLQKNSPMNSTCQGIGTLTQRVTALVYGVLTGDCLQLARGTLWYAVLRLSQQVCKQLCSALSYASDACLCFAGGSCAADAGQVEAAAAAAGQLN